MVSIEAGAYLEAVDLAGRQVTLVAAGDPGSVTVDARAVAAPAVACRGGEVTLRGLVLKAGDYPAVSGVGGTLTIEKCEVSAGYAAGVTVTDGTALTAVDVKVTGGQYGFVVEDAGGTLDRCEIRDVSDDGILVRLGANPTIRHSTVANCGYRGIYVYQAGRPIIERCDISGTGDAGISVAYQSAPTIAETWVHHTQGVGIRFGAGCGGTVRGTRVENTATPAMLVEEGANPEIHPVEERSHQPKVGVSAIEGATGQDAERLEKLLPGPAGPGTAGAVTRSGECAGKLVRAATAAGQTGPRACGPSRGGIGTAAGTLQRGRPRHSTCRGGAGGADSVRAEWPRRRSSPLWIRSSRRSASCSTMKVPGPCRRPVVGCWTARRPGPARRRPNPNPRWEHDGVVSFGSAVALLGCAEVDPAGCGSGAVRAAPCRCGRMWTVESGHRLGRNVGGHGGSGDTDTDQYPDSGGGRDVQAADEPLRRGGFQRADRPLPDRRRAAPRRRPWAL